MSLTVIINPKYTTDPSTGRAVEKFAKALPGLFAEGRLLHSGRNEIRSFPVGGRTVVVKRFGKMNLVKKLIYTCFRDNKALRSYHNSLALAARGVGTPEPIAYVGETSCGLLADLYYASELTTAADIRSELIDKEPWNGPLLKAYAHFVASLHEHGILHRDLNPTNVLYSAAGDGGFAFTLIDVNRMTFYPHPVPKAECMENLTLFWWLTPVYMAVLNEYAKARGWTAEDIQEAVRVKQVHDRRWVRRKRFTGLFKKKTKKSPGGDEAVR